MFTLKLLNFSNLFVPPYFFHDMIICYMHINIYFVTKCLRRTTMFSSSWFYFCCGVFVLHKETFLYLPPLLKLYQLYFHKSFEIRFSCFSFHPEKTTLSRFFQTICYLSNISYSFFAIKIGDYRCNVLPIPRWIPF